MSHFQQSVIKYLRRQKICLQLKIEAHSDIGILGPSHKLTSSDTEQLQVS
jgi:hypothetical protein